VLVTVDYNPVNMNVVFGHHHHHYHMSVMELGHLLTRSGLTYLEVSSAVCHDSFCQSGNSVWYSRIFRGCCHRSSSIVVQFDSLWIGS
jgi:hypothetical protein